MILQSKIREQIDTTAWWVSITKGQAAKYLAWKNILELPEVLKYQTYEDHSKCKFDQLS